MKPSHVGKRGMFTRLSDRAMRCGNCLHWGPLAAIEELAVLEVARRAAARMGPAARLPDHSGKGFGVGTRLLPPGSRLEPQGRDDPRMDLTIGLLAAHQIGRCRFGAPPTEHLGAWSPMTHMGFTCSRWSGHVKPEGGAAATELPGEAKERLGDG